MIRVSMFMSTKNFYKAYNWLKNIQSQLLPSICVVCQISGSEEQDICPKCLSQLPLLENPCLKCSLPLPAGQHHRAVCGTCLVHPPPFNYTISRFEYLSPINHLISTFKDKAQLCNGQALAEQLLVSLNTFYQHRDCPDALIPVPLHKKRLRQRGYNQSQELCRYLSKRMGISIDYKLCSRHENSRPQRGLSARERQRNLRNAFALEQPTNHLPYNSVAIVDDVITTASTVREITVLLKENGVNEVHIWSLARVCQ